MFIRKDSIVSWENEKERVSEGFAPSEHKFVPTIFASSPCELKQIHPSPPPPQP